MEPEKIIENNILIVEFMGGGYTDKIKPFYDSRYVETEYGVENIKDVKYHKDWNWLMPVVEKIETLGYCFTIGTKYAWIRKSKINSDIFIRKESDTKFSAIYQAIIEFINQI